MPLIDIEVIRHVLTEDQKSELMRLVTEAVVAVVGEPARRLTLVRLHEFDEGKWAIGGQPMHAANIHELYVAAAAKAAAPRH